MPQTAPVNAILLAAFGSRREEALEALAAMRRRAQNLYPDFRVETALTSGTVRRHRAALGGEGARPPEDILRGLAAEGVRRLAVQSLHVVPGKEFRALTDIAAALEGAPGGFERIVVGRPLLGGPQDVRRVAQAVLAVLPAKRAPDEAALFMGHGTKSSANAVYADLAAELRARDPRVLLGALEAEPGLAAKVEELRALGVTKVHLLPLLFTRGVHVARDMTGEGDDGSWRAGLSRAGFECVPHVRGAGERPEFVDIWLDHLREAVARLLA